MSKFEIELEISDEELEALMQDVQNKYLDLNDAMWKLKRALGTYRLMTADDHH